MTKRRIKRPTDLVYTKDPHWVNQTVRLPRSYSERLTKEAAEVGLLKPLYLAQIMQAVTSGATLVIRDDIRQIIDQMAARHGKTPQQIAELVLMAGIRALQW
jgi:hypothetical protein